MVTLNGGTYQEMVDIIRGLCLDFNIIKIAIGQGGGGLTLKDLLAQSYTYPGTRDTYPPLTDPEDEQHQLIEDRLDVVCMVKETQELNNFMYATLKSDMEHGRFIMPVTMFGKFEKEERMYREIQKTKTEMIVIEAQPTATGFRFVVPDKFQKDRVTACVLMNYLLSEKRKEYKPKEIELAAGFWVNV
jgi:hypothetical protein